MYVPWTGGVLALNAATGEELWRHDAAGVRMAGLATWRDPDSGKRFLYYHRNDRLHAISASDGRLIRQFGADGSVDLKEGLDRPPASLARVQSQSPGRVYANLVIVGSTGGADWNGPPGYVRAYHARTGKLVWTFHSIPQPGEPNFGGWPEGAWKVVGGANNWAGMSVDTNSGVLYIPFASANYNFYGANRPGDNLYANSLVAVDARSGKYLWHFQTVHHDVWDYDLPQAPKLMQLERNGQDVSAVAVAGKTGFVYTFDRQTGEPVFPIEERKVPASDVPGEQLSPTQPVPTAPPPFSRQGFSVDELSPYLSNQERDTLASELAGFRIGGLFTPPSLEGTVAMPGTSGGANWGNGVVDVESGRLFLVSHEVPSILKLERPSERTVARFYTADSPPGQRIYLERCAMCHGERMQGQPPAIPSLAGLAGRRDLAQMLDTVRRGRGPMPGFQLSPTATADLMTFLGFRDVPGEPAAHQAAVDSSPASDKEIAGSTPITYESGYNFLFSNQGIPANAPPWSNLTAYDMNKGELLWQKPYGSLPGMPGSGTIFPRGSIVGTAGGVLIAANQDRNLRAWDMDSGEVLLVKPLPSTPGGVPAVYAVGERQYIAVPVASYDPGVAKMTSDTVMPHGSNSLVVFALPDRPAVSN